MCTRDGCHLRILELAGNDRRASGAASTARSFRGEISALAQIRIYLCTKVGGFADRATRCSRRRRRTCRCSRATTARCHDELLGIAEGANVTPEEIVVANHYTDLRDLDPDPAKWRPAPMKDAPELTGASAGAEGLGGDGCSVIWAQSPTGRILAQTWDMHATAIPYVMVLSVPRDRRRAGGAAPHRHRLPRHGRDERVAGRRSRSTTCSRPTPRSASCGRRWSAARCAQTTAKAARDVIATLADRLGPPLLRRRPRRRVRARGERHAPQAGVRRRRELLPHEPLPRHRHRGAQQGPARRARPTTA